MTTAVLVTLGITLLALALFVSNRLDPSVVGLIVMTLLIVTGLVSAQQGVSGFSNEATVTVALMLVLSIGLLRTGSVDVISRHLGRIAGASEGRMLAVVVVVAVVVSAFLNNTAVVAILVPTILGLSHRQGFVPSRLLMPLSFATQMGGTLTLVGTSTNLVVAGLVLNLGLERIELFEITPPALAITATGVCYLLTLGRWLTPRRSASGDLLKQYEIREYLSALVVEAGSRLAGRSLAETRFGQKYGLNIVLVERGTERIRHPSGGTVLRELDVLLVQGKIADIVHSEGVDGLRLSGSTARLSRAEAGAASNVSSAAGSSEFAEVMVPPRSHVIGRTLAELNFRARFAVSALAIQRHGEVIDENVGRIQLEAGDILLAQGTAEALQELHDGRELALIGPVKIPAKRLRKRKLALSIMAWVILVPALEIAPILISAMTGTVAMFLTGCVTAEEVYDELDWSVLVLLATILPLGVAMQESGTAELLAATLLSVMEGWGPHGALAMLYVITVALTSVITNAAAAVVLTPIAVATASALGVSAMPFVVGVMFAASNSYLTPIGYQTNLFVYGPGGYRFSDFLRVGAGLTIVSVAVATVAIPHFFPFHPQ